MVSARPPRALADWTRGLAAGSDAPPPRVASVLVVSTLLRHRLAPLAHVQLRSTAPSVADQLRSSFEDAVGRHLRTRAVLGTVGPALDGQGIEWLVLKGPVLSEHAHPVPGARSYTDLDLLVRPEHLRPTAELLLSLGWRSLDRDHPLLLRRMPGELHLVSPSGIQVDLHWSLFNMPRTRLAFPYVEDELFENSRTVALGSHAVPTLGHEEFLLHVCLHAALSGADKLLYLVDIDQLVRNDPPDWSRLTDLAGRWGAGPAAALALGRARRLLGTPLEAPALRRMAGVSWRSLTRAVDVLAPMHRTSETGSLCRIVARASRPTSGQSWVELRHRTRSHLHDSVAVVASLAEDRPDDSALSAYFAGVLAEVGRRRLARAHQ